MLLFVFTETTDSRTRHFVDQPYSDTPPYGDNSLQVHALKFLSKGPNPLSQTVAMIFYLFSLLTLKLDIKDGDGKSDDFDIKVDDIFLEKEKKIFLMDLRTNFSSRRRRFETSKNNSSNAKFIYLMRSLVTRDILTMEPMT